MHMCGREPWAGLGCGATCGVDPLAAAPRTACGASVGLVSDVENTGMVCVATGSGPCIWGQLTAFVSVWKAEESSDVKLDVYVS